MSVQILLRRGTAAEWTSTNPILASGEFGYETDTKKLKIGDGSTAWTSLAYSEDKATFIPKSAITARGQIITGSDTADYAVLPIGSAGTLITQNPTTGVLSYQDVSLSSLSDANVAGAASGDLFTRGASQWGRGDFSTALSPFSASTRDLIATGIGESGYFSNAETFGSTGVNKWALPIDTVSATTSAPQAMYQHAGFSNPSVAGYFSKGRNISVPTEAIMYKWGFPSDSVSTTTAPPASMYKNAGLSHRAGFGLISQGRNSSGTATTTVYLYQFPADSVITYTAAPAAMDEHAGFANLGVASYFSRGGSTTTVYKWQVAGGTVSTTTAAPNNMRGNAGFSDSYVAGYFSQGNSSTTVYKWAFPTDTVTTTGSAPNPMFYHAGFSNPSVAGYFSQGNLTATVYKWAFPADTASTTTSATGLINGMYEHAGFANS